MLEVDFMTTEGNFDGAVSQIDEIIALSDGDDAIPYVFKANTLAQRAMFHFQIAQQYQSQADALEAQSLLKVILKHLFAHKNSKLMKSTKKRLN